MNAVEVGIKYEKYCMNLLQKKGYVDVSNTRASGDQGVDIIGYHDGVKFGFQCKFYSSAVGNHAIQEANAGAQFYKCNVAVVITNSTFTDAAKELAQEIGVVLWEKVEMNEESCDEQDDKEDRYVPFISSDRLVYYHFREDCDVYTNIFLAKRPTEVFEFTMNLPYSSKNVIMKFQTEYKNGSVIKLSKCGLEHGSKVGDLYCNILIGGNYFRHLYPNIYLPIKRSLMKNDDVTIIRSSMKPIEAKISDGGKVIRLKGARFEGIPGLNGSLFVEIIE